MIINNTDFKNAKNLPGGEENEQDLFQLFFSLRFEVKIHRNLTANEMILKVESYSKRQHKGAFFLIILREREAIMGTDGKIIMKTDIESFFHVTKCPTLHKVPKLFLIDVCLDEQSERVYSGRQSHDTGRLVPESLHPNEPRNKGAAKAISDFLLVYAGM